MRGVHGGDSRLQRLQLPRTSERCVSLCIQFARSSHEEGGLVTSAVDVGQGLREETRVQASVWTSLLQLPAHPLEDGQHRLVPTSSLEKQDRPVGLNYLLQEIVTSRTSLFRFQRGIFGKSVCVGDWRRHLLTRVTGHLEDGAGHHVAAGGLEDRPPEGPTEPCAFRVLAASL